MEKMFVEEVGKKTRVVLLLLWQVPFGAHFMKVRLYLENFIKNVAFESEPDRNKFLIEGIKKSQTSKKDQWR